MEWITPKLRKIGNFYVLEDDELSVAVVQANPDVNPVDLLWKIREEERKTFGDDYVNDIHPDEPIRRIVKRKHGP